MVGYADAKVPDSAPGRPRWCDVPMDEAVHRLVAEIRELRPEALVTFDALGGLTGHPDHLHTHRVTMRAAEAAGLDVYPDAGPSWAPSAVYLATHPRSSVQAVKEIVGARRAVNATPGEEVTDRVDAGLRQTRPARRWSLDTCRWPRYRVGGGVWGGVMVGAVVGCRVVRVVMEGRSRWCRTGRVGTCGRGDWSTRPHRARPSRSASWCGS
jgi:hypothetical protein